MKQHRIKNEERGATTAQGLFASATHLFQQGMVGEARGRCSTVLSMEQSHIGAMCLLAICLHQEGDATAALETAGKALALNTNSLTLCTFGIVARGSGNSEAAETAYRQAALLAPSSPEVHNELALLLSERGRIDEAEVSYRRAIAINSKYAEAYNNLGVLMKSTGRIDEALVAYQRALEINPEYAEAHNNIGVLKKESGDLIAAECAYRRALTLKSEYADASWNLSMVLLSQGRYEEGWRHYEARHHPNRTEAVSVKPNLPCPQWSGESLCGHSIVVWTEQGYGDYIQFARYIPLLKRLGARHLTVACPPPLRDLLATVEGVDCVITAKRDAGNFDFWVFPMSLPFLLGVSVGLSPVDFPYLHTISDRVTPWSARLQGHKRKVGLVWKGNPNHSNDVHRSLTSLAQLEPLWSVSDITFVSLQKGAGETDIACVSDKQPLVDASGGLKDFADTAALVSCLDLVITVDTAVAHVAGALGKACWLLLPYVGCDWRWLNAGATTAWYAESTRLFRQSSPGQWSPVIESVSAALSSWSAASPFGANADYGS